MTQKLALAVLLVFVIFLIVCQVKKAHVIWYFYGHDATVTSFNFSPLVEPEDSSYSKEDFTSHHSRNLSLKIPSCYLSQTNGEEFDSFYAESYKCENKQIAIMIPITTESSMGSEISGFETISHPVYHDFVNLPVLERYQTLAQASADDFSFMMSHRELQEHMVKILFKRMNFGLTSSLNIEYDETEKEVGILLCHQDRGSVEYTRYLKGDDSPFIVLHFTKVDTEDETEMAMIRKTCLSIEREHREQVNN